MKKQLVIIIGLITWVTACQQTQKANLAKLLLLNQTTERQCIMLSEQQINYLYQGNRLIQYTTLQADILPHLKELITLMNQVHLKLIVIDSLQQELIHQVGMSDSTFCTGFVVDGMRLVQAGVFIETIKQLNTFEEALYYKYPLTPTKKVKGKGRQIVQWIKAHQYNVAWTLLYTDLTHWKLTLLQNIQRVITQQTEGLALKKNVYNRFKVTLGVIAESQTVLEGEEYKAKIFLANYNFRRLQVHIKINHQRIPTYNGVGQVRILPKKPGVYEWLGEVLFKNRGRDTTFVIRKKYLVLPK